MFFGVGILLLLILVPGFMSPAMTITTLFACKIDLFLLILFLSELLVFFSGKLIFHCRDLGFSNISGTLGPELGELKHLQFL